MAAQEVDNRDHAGAPVVPVPRQRVYELLAWALADRGVRKIFCLMGNANLELLAHIAEAHGGRLIHARHEQGAVAMADGYARATGGIGVCSVTSGPGLTNAATSLAAAARHRSRVVLIAGDIATGDRNNAQRIDQRAFIETLGVRCIEVRTGTSAVADLDAALRHAAEGRGPVALDLPLDVQHARAELGQRGGRWQPPVVQVVEANLAAVDSAAEVLASAHRPALLVGRGAASPAARAAVVGLAEALGAPIVTTLRANGLAHGHPLDAGVAGALGRSGASAALLDADVVCALGTRLDTWTVAGGRLLETAMVIQVDIDAAALGDTVPVDVPVVGDAGRTAAALAARIRRVHPAREAWWHREDEHGSRVDFEDGPGAVDPRRVVEALNASLGPDRIVVLDGGHFAIFTAQRLDVPSPERFFFTSDFGAIGQGLGVAVGVAFARPGERVTAILGDGCLMMALADLETIARYRLPITVLVMDDDGFGQERHSLVAKGFSPHAAAQPTPDLAQVAQVLGIEGHRVESPADLQRLTGMLRQADGPVLADIRINGAIVNPAAQSIFQPASTGERG